jgi:hypothetical protein
MKSYNLFKATWLLDKSQKLLPDTGTFKVLFTIEHLIQKSMNGGILEKFG